MSHQDNDQERREEPRRTTSWELRMQEWLEKLSERVLANEDEARRRDEETQRREEAAQRREEATQRTIEFILQQQAKFTTDMQELREAVARSERHWEGTAVTIRDLLAITQIQSQEIGALAEAQARTDEQMKETDERIKELQAQTQAQMKETDERLNALIDVVEKSISERNNGGGARGPEV